MLAAPTGSGKTGVMELAVLRLMSRHIGPDGGFRPPGGATKVVYLAPMRALVQERVKSWQDRWGQGARPAWRGPSTGIIVLSLRPAPAAGADSWPLPSSPPALLLARRRFARVLGLSVVELSGDVEPSPQDLDAADLICSTPEKFDAITRKYKEFGNARFFGEVGCWRRWAGLPSCIGPPGRLPACDAPALATQGAPRGCFCRRCRWC